MTLRTISLVPPPREAESELSSWKLQRPPSGSSGRQAMASMPTISTDGPARLLDELGHGQLEHRRRRAVGSRPGLHLEVGGQVAQDHLLNAQLHQAVAEGRALVDPAPLGLVDHGVEAAPRAAARADGAQGLAFEGEHGAGDPPPVVDLAEDVGHGHAHAVEEDLVEVGLAGELAQRAHRDAGVVHVDDEHGDAVALGPARVGPGQAGGVVAVLRARRPDLLAVDDELVAVAAGPGLHAREVGAGAGLAEELAPHVLAAQQRWDEGALLLLAAVDQDGRSAHAEPDFERAGRDLEGPRLLVEDALVASGEAAPSVLGRPGDAGQAGVGQGALEGDRPLDAAPVGLTGAAATAARVRAALTLLAFGGQGGAQKGEDLRAEFVFARGLAHADARPPTAG